MMAVPRLGLPAAHTSRGATSGVRRLALANRVVTALLLATAVLVVPGAVEAAGWSPALPNLYRATALALVAALLAAAIPLRGAWLVALLALLGSAVVIWQVTSRDDLAQAPTLAAQLGELTTRIGDWADRLASGRPIRDPLPFVFLVLCGVWIIVAGGVVVALRARRPWPLLIGLAIPLLVALDAAPESGHWRLPLFVAAAFALAAHARLPTRARSRAPTLRLTSATIASTALIVAALWFGVRTTPTDWLTPQLDLPWSTAEPVAPAVAPTASSLDGGSPTAPLPLPPRNEPAVPPQSIARPPLSIPNDLSRDDLGPQPTTSRGQSPALAPLYIGAALILVGAAVRAFWVRGLHGVSPPERNWRVLCRLLRLIQWTARPSRTELELATALHRRLPDQARDVVRLAIDVQRSRYSLWQPTAPEISRNNEARAAVLAAIRRRLLRSFGHGVRSSIRQPPWRVAHRVSRPPLPSAIHVATAGGLLGGRAFRVAVMVTLSLAAAVALAWLWSDGSPRADPRSLQTAQQPPAALQAAQASVAADPPSLPADPTLATTPAFLRRYEVRPGDNLTTIAAVANVSVADLASLNGLTDPDVISVGQILLLPEPVRHENSIERGSLR